MKQKIVMKVEMHSEKCRNKALKIAAVAHGVNSVSLDGEGRDLVVVTGDGMDSVCLTNDLRKKFRYVSLASVEELKAEDGAENKEEETKPIEYIGYYSPCPPPYPYYQVVYDPHPATCSIM